MITKTYRAKSMQEALALIRQELGPDAAVLHTRDVSGGLLRWMLGGRRIEVTASRDVNVPTRLPEDTLAAGHETNPVGYGSGSETPGESSLSSLAPVDRIPTADELDYRSKFRDDLQTQVANLHSMMEELCRQNDHRASHELPESLFQLFTDLIDAEVEEELVRELIDRVRSGVSGNDIDDPVLLRARLSRLVEDEINVCGPIQITPGRRRLVALIGPTGVGKTTTIAKLAANFRLRDRLRVGLITVDTYRIAAVEQLRTYADIMDLPMEVVATPRDMRQAVERMSNLDLILLDTAGRSPRDELKIQELKSMLAEAQPDEVHLVLSAVAGAANLRKTAERFAEVGATALILTKLDETSGLGNLLPLLRSCDLPLSYVTNGQNVPDDIEQAERRKLARGVLGMEPETV